MFPGQWIKASNTTVTLWSPWFPRGADNAIFTYEQMVKIGSASFDVDVFHKNTEETGDGAAASGASFTAVSGTKFFTTDMVENLKELVRFRYQIMEESGTSEALFRMLAPTWIVPAAV